MTQVLADAPHGRTRDADGAIVFVPFNECNDAVTGAARYGGEWHHFYGICLTRKTKMFTEPGRKVFTSVLIHLPLFLAFCWAAVVVDGTDPSRVSILR